jgi:hypothetical protein
MQFSMLSMNARVRARSLSFSCFGRMKVRDVLSEGFGQKSFMLRLLANSGRRPGTGKRASSVIADTLTEATPLFQRMRERPDKSIDTDVELAPVWLTL